MSWCPACGMDGFIRTVRDTDPDRGEYEQATCSYCGYQDEAEWLPEGWDEQEPDDEGNEYVGPVWPDVEGQDQE